MENRFCSLKRPVFSSKILFYFKFNPIFRNITFGVLQLLTTILTFVYVGYLCRVQSRYKTATGMVGSNNGDEVARF